VTNKISGLVIGNTYDREFLANTLDYKSRRGIERGIVTPRNQQCILLLITSEKSKGMTQYIDHFDGEILKIEGEKGHINDLRIINAETNKEEIHLFFRETNKLPFTYYGKVTLKRHEIHKNKPSHFEFSTEKNTAVATSNIITEEITHGIVDEQFIPDFEGRKIIKTHTTYERSPKNRAKCIELQGNTCKICGFNFNEMYGEDLARDYIEVHHITPVSSSEQKIDPATDLIPLCSNCHSMIHRYYKITLRPDELKKRLLKK
jgi:5-methylcytosine-specific restriction protein A